MVHRCCISSCGMSVRVLEAKGLSYHKFPTKETIRDQWVQAIIPHMDRPESFKVVPRYTRVCSRHFRKKDYCMDAKKRARLISNAVPSVFPRKNTPLVIPTVLPVSPKLTNPKLQTPTDTVPGTSSNCKSNQKTVISGIVPTSTSNSTASKLIDNTSMQPKEIDGKQLDDLLGRRELVIESAAIQDDHLVLTVMDPASQVDIECVSVSNSDDQSQGSLAIKIEESCGGTKRRKRRKWNRTAFARPPKGKRKLLSVKPEPSIEQDISESLSDLPSHDDGRDTLIDIKHENLHVSTSVDELQSSSNDNESMSNVTLLLSDLPNQPYQIASVEQELLQSIQAVSLRCVGDHEDVDSGELHDAPTDEVYQYNNLVPAFLHHHSSEESLFSNESQNVGGGSREGHLNLTSQSDAATEDDSLRFELVDLRIDPDSSLAPSQPPSYFDIDELAHQLNSSLFTDGKIPLFSTDNLSLNSETSSDLNLTDPLLITPDRNSTEDSAKSTNSGEKIAKPSIKKGASQKMKGSSRKDAISPKEKKLKGVSKRPKKDKINGKFSVERFKNSDKDIEYYTGFNSYRNFEAFFRSLEAYIERICITDVTYGVNNMPTTADRNASCSTSTAEGISPKSNEQPKKRPCQGRAMSRINELFMTIIRLRRKLPEKVLGHMFFISQPTVSRVVRAWTVLLSKIIDSYPVESSLSSSSAYKEHSYTSKGLGIPDSFRDLFYSDLAKSIVITSLNPKKMKPKTSTSQCTRNKKSKRNSVTTMKGECEKPNQPNNEKLMSEGSDFLLANVENPVPIEQLHLFDYI